MDKTFDYESNISGSNPDRRFVLNEKNERMIMMEILGGFAQRNSVSFMTKELISTSTFKNGKIENVVKKKKVKIKRTPILLLNLILDFAVEIPKKYLGIVLGISTLATLFMFLFMQSTKISNSLSFNNENIITNVFSVLVFLMFLKFYLGREHGAEHKVFNASKDMKVVEQLECLNFVKQYSRVTENCGSRLYVLLVTLQFITTYLFHNVFINLLVFEAILQFDYRIGVEKIPILNKLNMFLQKYIFTKEPDEKHLKIAINSWINLNERIDKN